MNYYFPSILNSVKFSGGKLAVSLLSVNSGENAVRLLLRSYSISAGSKIAVPVYVCDSLKQAVIKEGFEPLYLDLKNDGTFWTDHDPEILSQERPAAIILVHLYGFLHPDTNAVMDFCKRNNIFLIHDTAQSYGIDEGELTYTSGLFCSFGPGKSSTAAGGAYVKGLTEEFYQKNCQAVSGFSLQNLKAKLFLKSRVYGYKFSLTDRLLQRLVYLFKNKDAINKMTGFQLAAATAAMEMVKEKRREREERYNALLEAVKSNTLLSAPFGGEKGLGFKIVFSVKNDVMRFKEHLKKNNVAFYSLYDDLLLGKEKHPLYPVFLKNAITFIELSTEATLPFNEIERVAGVLRQYR